MGFASAVTQYDQEFQDNTIILFILTDKTKAREKFSKISKRKTIITEILYCLAFVKLYFLRLLFDSISFYKINVIDVDNEIILFII